MDIQKSNSGRKWTYEVVSIHMHAQSKWTVVPLIDQGPAQNGHCILQMVIPKQQWQSDQDLSNLYLKPNAVKHRSTQKWS